MLKPKLNDLLLLFLRLGAFCCFAGWTWTHLYWEAPYGVLLWSESTYELAESFGISWEEFVGTGANDGVVQKWMGRVGWLYLACAILTLTVREKSRIQMAFLIGGSGLLTILTYAKYVKVQYQLPMLVEHGGQILSPVLLVLALALGVRHRATIIVAMVAFVATFAGHGAYALGVIWPTPGTFYGMTTVILHVEYETAKTFLQIAGVLDFLICVGIFIPFLRRASALYGAAWGLATALARPVAGMSTSLNYFGADQFLHEAILRAPHFMIPLFLLFVWRKESEEPNAAN